jgi:HSP20 family protein
VKYQLPVANWRREFPNREALRMIKEELMHMTRSKRRELGEWSPGTQLTRLRNQINRLFEIPFGSEAAGPSSLEAWTPAVDVFENQDNITVKTELPGMRKEDIDVSVEGNNLSICGERSEEKEEGKGTANYRSERYFGRFYRSVPLPSAVDTGKIAARYQDGILTVTLPKTEEAKRKKIDIAVA